MAFQAPGNNTPDVVTQESLLLGAVERVGRVRQGRIAVHVHLSRLQSQNRQEGHVRIALRMLEPMVNAYRGQMFLLGNSDVVFMVKDPNLTDVENMIYKLRALFSKDALTFADAGDGIDNFCTWYDLNGPDYQSFLNMAKQATAEARARLKEQKEQGAAGGPVPIDAKSLGIVLERLARTDVTRLIRRQAAIVVTESNTAEVVFQEFFVSVAELQKLLAPDISLTDNRWLFQHLSLALDQRVLNSLGNAALRAWPVTYAVNLNLETVLSPEFADFAAAVEQHSGISVEIQVLDALADSRRYFDAKARLREAKQQIAIDGLNELTLQFMDVAQFDADLYKLNWSPEMRESERSETVLQALRPLEMGRLLLARCDSESAIQWGLGHGITRFQGRYVDSMLAAYTMAICDKSAACTLGQCIARHGVLSGPPRHECGNLQMLDTPPVMRAIRARMPKAEAPR